MALRILQFRLPNNKILKVEIEETMQVSTFIKKLKSTKHLDDSKDYSLKTQLGIEVADTATFKGFDVSVYIITEAIVYTAPPSPPVDWGGLGDMIVPPSFHQLGIFVIDGSASMTANVAGNITRAQAVNGAVRETLTHFKTSRKNNCFSFSIVAFGDHAKTITQAESATSIDSNANYDPLQYFEGGSGSSSTNIGSGLSEASKIATHFLNNKTSSVPHKVAIVLLTDGMCHEAMKTKLVAEQLKQNPNIQVFCCCLEDAGKKETDEAALLKQIASNPVTGYKAVYDKGTIRGFFVNSITAAMLIQ